MGAGSALAMSYHKASYNGAPVVLSESWSRKTQSCNAFHVRQVKFACRGELLHASASRLGASVPCHEKPPEVVAEQKSLEMV